MDDTNPDDILAVRDLVPDDEPVFGDNEDEYLFTDAQISRILNGVAKGNILRAVGLLCISVGNSEALIGKVIKTQDLSTDASKLQDTWGKRGEYYIGLADKEDEAAAGSYFGIVDFREGWEKDRPELTEYEFLW